MGFTIWLRSWAPGASGKRQGWRRAAPGLEPLEERVLLSAGALDLTFGAGGLVLTDLNGGTDAAAAVALQPDRKIVVAGTADGDFAVIRYNEDGSLDATFGTGGIVRTDFAPVTGFASFDQATALVLQPDGRIVVAGHADTEFALARYNADGSLDSSFGEGGLIRTDVSTGGALASSVVVQPDGRIVVGGTEFSDQTITADFALVRYLPDGSLDRDFDADGKLVTDIDAFDELRSLLLRPDGKLVAVGRVRGADPGVVLVGYNPDGSRDFRFGQNDQNFGSANLDVGAAILEPDGQVLVVATDGFTAAFFELLRYDADGLLRNLTNTRFEEGAAAAAIALQPDGNILVAGRAPDGGAGRISPWSASGPTSTWTPPSASTAG